MKNVGMVLFLWFLISLGPATGTAQTIGGTIHGRISIVSGTALPGVEVAAVNEGTGEERVVRSDSRGDFIFLALMPGAYRIEASASGFRRWLGKGIALQIGQDLTLDVTLEAGGPDEVITVTAAGSLIETDQAGHGTRIENNQIVNYPLDARDFLQLSLLAPGAVPAAQGSPGSVRGEPTINVSGSREDSNSYYLDGAYNNDPKLNSFAVDPPVDAIREFEILSGTYDASFGRTAGAQVNVALKSGTNAFHGTAYEFFRNAALDARNFFARTEDDAPRYQRNQFGFSLGGPLQEDRTFFFLDYEGRRLREGITQVANVPTEQERQGDFSQSILPQPRNPYTGQTFDNGRIPSPWMNPIGVAIAGLYPLPNRDVPGQNYVASPARSDRDDRFDLRLDHTLSAKASLLGRYSFSDLSRYEPYSGAGFARVPGFGTDIPRRAQNLLLGEDHVFSASFINQARLTFNRVANGSFHENLGNSLNRSVGLPELSSNPRDFGLSLITISGFSPIGDEYNNPQHGVTNLLQMMDSASYARGNHVLKMGVDFRNLQQNAYRDVQSRGMLTFSDYAVTGNGLADLLLGYLTYSGGARLDNAQHLRTRSWNFYLQDSYRLRSGVTLQFGLRYEYNSPPADRFNRASLYDPESQSLVPAGGGGVPPGGYAPDRNNFGPRIGIAWSPGTDDRSVVRAGYGIYYDQSSLAPGEGLYFNQPYYDFSLYFPLQGMPLTLADPFPANYPYAIAGSAFGFDRNLRTPYYQQWNLSVERQFGTATTLELAYAGSKGTKILSARDINQPAASPAQPNPRPVPQFADITFLESRGSSSYHSLQVRMQQRLQAGFAALVSYTFGKSMDETSTFFPSAGDPNFPQNSYDTAAEKARSNYDVRHRLSVGWSYDLSSALGAARLSNSGFSGSLLRNWSAHGIVTFQSGRPFTVALLPEIDNSNTGIASLGFGANNRPDRPASGELSHPGPDAWFDTAAFALAAYGSFGNSGRNILDGPGYQDVSLSLLKDAAIREGLRLQFRAEFFNAFNHTNFDLPDNFLGSPSFGKIQSARSPRRIQFGLKMIF